MPRSRENAAQLRQHQGRDADWNGCASMDAVGEYAESDGLSVVEPDKDANRLGHLGEPRRTSERRTRPSAATWREIAHTSHSIPWYLAATASNGSFHHSGERIVMWAFSPFGRCFFAG